MLELSYLAAASRVDRLDADQLVLLRLVALGMDDDEIASRLGTGPGRTRQAVRVVFATLGVRPTPHLSRRSLARLALRPYTGTDVGTVPDVAAQQQRAG